ncbi:MAG: D-alanine--D-alanine ligase [Armatimonadaceae bacterium]
MKVAVLMGGTSAEREVSLSTGRQIVAALDPEKYEASSLDTTDLPQLAVAPKAERPDVVFIALHGPGGEDGAVQGFLETLGIPYTGSGVLASALAMDKYRCKTFLATESINTPPGMVYFRQDAPRIRRAPGEVTRNLGYPVIVKPSRQGSTYGCTVVDTEGDMASALSKAFAYDDTVLVEQRLAGTEITVSVLGNHYPEALPVVEIVPPEGFFDYESKYSQDPDKAAEEIVPARLPDDILREAQEIAIRCHRMLGCRGMSRTDMFVLEHGDVVTLEVNTIPGMTPTSLLPKAAAAAGISFAELCDKLIAFALEKPV